MKTIKINIPAMQSEHCRIRVINAIADFKDVENRLVQPGSVTLQINDSFDLKNVYTAINSAGYEILGIETVNPDNAENRTLSFKSNIKCAGCIQQVAPALNNRNEIASWNVDISNADKILTVESNGISSDEIIQLVKSTGFIAEEINKH